jgi:hypothetical protein
MDAWTLTVASPTFTPFPPRDASCVACVVLAQRRGNEGDLVIIDEPVPL